MRQSSSVNFLLLPLLLLELLLLALPLPPLTTLLLLLLPLALPPMAPPLPALRLRPTLLELVKIRPTLLELDRVRLISPTVSVMSSRVQSTRKMISLASELTTTLSRSRV